uniref:Uncharacterized protein n=1 Tax=Arundo donax TaxID=35708 RepID=A0A0A9BBI7_ARUDO
MASCGRACFARLL